MHGHFDLAGFGFRFEADRLGVEHFLVRRQVFHEVDEAVLVLEGLALEGAVFVLHALVGEVDLQAFVEEGHLAEALSERVVVEGGRLGEDFGVGPELHRGARVLGRADLLELFNRLAALEGDFIKVAVAGHLHRHVGGKRVDDRYAHAVQTAGDLVAFAAELAAGVQDGEHDLDGGDMFLGMDVDGDAAAVVDALHAAVFHDIHVDIGAVSGQGLVDRVVDDLVYQVMQAARARRADVHARALADRLQAFEDLDVTAVVMGWFRFCHALLLLQ